MDSVTAENVARLRKERDDMMKELDILTRTTPEQIWIHELENLEIKYGEYKKVREQIQNAEPTTTKKVGVKKAKAAGGK